MQNLITMPSIVTIDQEPRVRDLDLAARLEFSNVYEARRLIERNREELEAHGEVSVTVTETGPRGGRPGKCYYLNEGQALVICALSRTAVAAEVRKALIEVFMAYRAGKIVHVREHHRRPPCSLVDHGADDEIAELERKTVGIVTQYVDRPDWIASKEVHLVRSIETVLAEFTGDYRRYSLAYKGGLMKHRHERHRAGLFPPL